MKKLFLTLTLMVAITSLTFAAFSFTVKNTSAWPACTYTVTAWQICNTASPSCCTSGCTGGFFCSGPWIIAPGVTKTFSSSCSGTPNWSSLSVTIKTGTCNAFTFGNASAGPVVGNCASCTSQCDVTVWDRISDGVYQVHAELIPMIPCRIMNPNAPIGEDGEVPEANSDMLNRLGIEGSEIILKESNTTVSSLANIPNPVSEALNINFELMQDADVAITLFDITGKEVLSVKKGIQAKGKNSFDVDVSSLSSGMYSYSFKAGDAILTRKFNIVR